MIDTVVTFSPQPTPTIEQLMEARPDCEVLQVLIPVPRSVLRDPDYPDDLKLGKPLMEIVVQQVAQFRRGMRAPEATS